MFFKGNLWKTWNTNQILQKITKYNYLFSILKGVLVKTDKVFSFNPSGMRSLQNGKSIEVKEVVHKNMIDTRHSQSVSLSY